MAVVVAEAVDTDPPSSGRNPPTHVLPSSGADAIRSRKIRKNHVSHFIAN